MGSDPKQPLVYKVFLTKRCEKRYARLQESEKRHVGSVIEQIRANPKIGYPLKDPVLRDLYSVHAGNFRIVYKFTNNPAEIELWAMELRKHVYEELVRYRSTVREATRVELARSTS